MKGFNPFHYIEDPLGRHLGILYWPLLPFWPRGTHLSQSNCPQLLPELSVHAKVEVSWWLVPWICLWPTGVSWVLPGEETWVTQDM